MQVLTVTGKCYHKLKQYQLAIKDYNEAIRLEPDLAFAYNNRGYTYSALKQYQLAIKDYNEAIRLNPDFVFAYNNRGNAYHASGKIDEGCRSLIRACELGFCEEYESAKQRGFCASMKEVPAPAPAPEAAMHRLQTIIDFASKAPPGSVLSTSIECCGT